MARGHLPPPRAPRSLRAAAPQPGAYASPPRAPARAAPAAPVRTHTRERTAVRQAADREQLRRYNRAKADYRTYSTGFLKKLNVAQLPPTHTLRCVMYIDKYILEGSGLD